MPWQQPADAAWVREAALLGYDFGYCGYHRFGHRVAVAWAAHAVHHQRADRKLSTALCQTGCGIVLGGQFYLPLALLGVLPLVMGKRSANDFLASAFGREVAEEAPTLPRTA